MGVSWRRDDPPGRSAFGADFEYQRHNIRAAVAAHIDTANVAGELPYVGATSFHAEAYPW
jgi:hypothetical protein